MDFGCREVSQSIRLEIPCIYKNKSSLQRFIEAKFDDFCKTDEVELAHYNLACSFRGGIGGQAKGVDKEVEACPTTPNLPRKKITFLAKNRHHLDGFRWELVQNSP